ncbi:hypothetical protein BaRGS_00037411 [Batillaria attramentaria]|uniref:Uncharacterized protein n=1 Tax=Batillaria attramentaria TaxID=370345 RepID=A0ABD0J8Z7_9CAEN
MFTNFSPLSQAAERRTLINSSLSAHSACAPATTSGPMGEHENVLNGAALWEGSQTARHKGGNQRTKDCLPLSRIRLMPRSPFQQHEPPLFQLLHAVLSPLFEARGPLFETIGTNPPKRACTCKPYLRMPASIL